MNNISNKPILFGAIIGDIAGSCYEFTHRKDYNVDLFPHGCDITDDSILTIATAYAILHKMPFEKAYKKFGKMYPNPKGCYGGTFSGWVNRKDHSSNFSMGNGAPMRVSPCGYVYGYEEALHLAEQSASCSHMHWQAIRAAQAVTECIYMALHGSSIDDISFFVLDRFNYLLPSLDAEYKKVQSAHKYTELAEPTTIDAIWCALSANSYEDAIRRAIGLGGDADTLAAIAGSIAEPLFGIPDELIEKAKEYIPKDLLDIINEFNNAYNEE